MEMPLRDSSKNTKWPPLGGRAVEEARSEMGVFHLVKSFNTILLFNSVDILFKFKKLT